MNRLAKCILSSFLSVVVVSVIGLVSYLPAQADDWTENIKPHGDLRYRHEVIDKQGTLQRTRQRIRARFGIKADVGSDVVLNFTLASGSTDPISTNQTLDGGFTSKQINLDIASFLWTPAKAPGLTLTGGKIKTPFYRPGGSELIWDGDLRPEGASARYQRKLGAVRVFATVAGFWFSEDKGSDGGLGAVQGGIMIPNASGTTRLTGGASYFDYGNLRGQQTLVTRDEGFGNSVNRSFFDAFGNLIVGDGVYLFDYNILELFGEFTTQTGSLVVQGYFDFAKNMNVPNDDEGWLVGVTIGKAKTKTGSWKVRYNYRRLESDAVLGAFTNSDFGGGGADARGHEFGLKVQLGQKVSIASTLFINETGLSRAILRDFNRFQLDLSFKL